jgi:hypothetical protein
MNFNLAPPQRHIEKTTPNLANGRQFSLGFFIRKSPNFGLLLSAEKVTYQY